VDFVFYATDDQAQEILAEVGTQGFGEVRLFKSAVEDGQPIDGSTVIEQFHHQTGLGTGQVIVASFASSIAKPS
jgi:hypothetical protein